jgi:hypothetical protein
MNSGRASTSCSPQTSSRWKSPTPWPSWSGGGSSRPPDAALKLADVLSSLPDLHPCLPDLLPRAFAIASAARIGVYDCLYVALAEREGCEVLTSDVRMKNALPGSPIVLLSSLP